MKAKKTVKKTVSKNAAAACPEIRTFKLAELAAADYNPRTIGKEAMEGLAYSIQRFGCVEPIIVNVREGQNRIVGGHQRHKALTAAGVAEALCVTVDLDDSEERLLNLSLNNPEIQGEFIDSLDAYIEDLAGTVEDVVILNLRIDHLKKEIQKSEDEINLPDKIYQILCECKDEKEQKEIYEILIGKGYKCRLLNL